MDSRKIVAQTGSKLHLDPDTSCFNLDQDPSSFNLGLGTYCTLPSKILYNPNKQHHEHLIEDEKKISAQIRSVAATLYKKVDLDK